MGNPLMVSPDQSVERVKLALAALEEMVGVLERMAESLQSDYTFTDRGDFTPGTVGLSTLATEIASARHRLLGAVLDAKTTLMRCQLRDERLTADLEKLNTAEAALRARAIALEDQERLLDARKVLLDARLGAVEAGEGFLARISPTEAQNDPQGGSGEA